MDRAWSASAMVLASAHPIRVISLDLSMVRICSIMIIESEYRPWAFPFMNTWVGNLCYTELKCLADLG